MTGIEYPTITVGDHRDMVVRFSFAAQLLMQRRGLDPARVYALTSPKIRQADGTDAPNPDFVRNIYTVFASMVAENFIDLSKPHRVDLDNAPTPDYWACQIDDIGAASHAIWSAVGKVLEGLRRKLEVAPPVEAKAS